MVREFLQFRRSIKNRRNGTCKPLLLLSLCLPALSLSACGAIGGGSEVDTARSWLEGTYGDAGEAIDFGCSVGPVTAAGLDWYPEIGFSLESLEDAWAKICD